MKKLTSNDKLNKECYSKYWINDNGELFKELKNGKYKELKGSINPDGYRRYDLRDRKNKKGKCFFSHNLVMMVFEDYEGEVDHIDRNKLNNHISNLYKTTRSENVLNRDKMTGKITKEELSLVKELYELGLSLVKISERTGLGYQQVRRRVSRIK